MTINVTLQFTYIYCPFLNFWHLIRAASPQAKTLNLYNSKILLLYSTCRTNLKRVVELYTQGTDVLALINLELCFGTLFAIINSNSPVVSFHYLKQQKIKMQTEAEFMIVQFR
jgi:hypothetical protein